jgi:NHL repeat
MQTGRRGFAGAVATLMLVCALALTSGAPAAAAAIPDFCPRGEAAGQCGAAELNSLRGLALDFETGRLYVADRANNRVEVFEEDGTFLFAFGWGVDTGAPEAQTCTGASGCQAGIATAEPGGFDGPARLAVDNIAGSASRHDVYVVDADNHRIEKFSPLGALIWAKGSEGEVEGQLKSRVSVGVGPAGAVYVLDNLFVAGSKYKQRLQHLDPATGNPVPSQCIVAERGQGLDLAVEPDGSFWVASEAEGLNPAGKGLRKYDAACAQLLPPSPAEEGLDADFTNANVALSLDEAGRLFLAADEPRLNKANAGFQVITAREPSGQTIARFGYGRLFPANPEGLVAHTGGEGGVFVAFGSTVGDVAGIRRLDPELPPLGPVTAPPSLEVKKVGGAKAIAVAEVNPEGDPTQIHVEYLSEAAWKAQGESFAGPLTEETDPVDLGAEGFRLASKEFPIGCPNPSSETKGCLATETKYRWRVVATNAAGGGEGTVKGAPFTTRPSPELGATYATDVGTDAATLTGEVDPWGHAATGYFEYVTDAVCLADEEAGGDCFDHAARVPDTGAGQAPLEFGAGEEELASRQVTLQPLAPGTAYRYRLVVNGAKAVTSGAQELRTFAVPDVAPCENDESRIGAGALLPDCRAYELVSPLDKEGGDIRVGIDSLGQRAVLEQASRSGEELAYGSVRSFGGAESAPYTSQYIARRIAGSEWETHPIEVPRGKPLGGATEQFHSEFKAFSEDLCQAWVGTYAEMPGAPPGFQPGARNLLRRSDGLCGPAALEALAPLGPQLAFNGDLLGTSADGSHAIFTTSPVLSGGGVGPQQLYESVDGATPRKVCYPPGSGTPIAGLCTAGTNTPTGLSRRPNPGSISADGRRVFFSTGGNGPRPLYVRIDGKRTEEVSEAAEAAEGVEGSEFWGASSDGSTAVFSVGQVVTSSGGDANARIYSLDVDAKAKTKIAGEVLGVLGVSADAQRVYFASKQAIVGSGKNSVGTEAIAGQPNLYLYQAGGGGATSFVATLSGADLQAAVSDNDFGLRTSRVSPGGGAALFVSTAPLSGYDNVEARRSACGLVESVAADRCPEIYHYDAASGKLDCVSCNPTGARPQGPGGIPAYETPMHAARAISDDGSRVFFESADRLAARDSNGVVDVYEWEQVGTGGCATSSYDYSVSDGGCVELISSGQSPIDSRLVESSPDGRDAFFATGSSLLPQDYGLFDVYDARVGGGLPIPGPTPPSCEGEACQSPAPAPRAITPASSAFEGPGNPPHGRCPKGRRRVERHGRAHCVKRHAKKANHHRRAR